MAAQDEIAIRQGLLPKELEEGIRSGPFGEFFSSLHLESVVQRDPGDRVDTANGTRRPDGANRSSREMGGDRRHLCFAPGVERPFEIVGRPTAAVDGGRVANEMEGHRAGSLGAGPRADANPGTGRSAHAPERRRE